MSPFSLSAREWRSFLAWIPKSDAWALAILLSIQVACGGGSGSSAPSSVPPSNLTYSLSSVTYRLGTPAIWDVPSHSGSDPSSYSVSPTLPPGIVLNPVNGVISGTPTSIVSTSTYSVKASNSAGSTSCTLTITVKDIAPDATIFAQSNSFYSEVGVKASVPPAPGMTYQWTLTDGTATGTITSGDTENVVTYSTGPNPGTYQLTVQVQNQSGESAVSTRSLNVVGSRFLRGLHTPDQRWRGTETTLKSGRILVVGGIIENPSNTAQVILATADLYDPYTDTWCRVPDMSTGRVDHAATLLPSGKVLIAGGAGPSGNLSSAELYDPSTNSWAPAGSMSVARLGLTATLLPTGKVMVVGGSSSDASAKTVELYDPVANAWTTSSVQAYFTHNDHTATLLQDGRVLVSGGDGTETYSPLVDQWTKAQAPDYIMYPGHTASLLDSGQVLVVGGAEGSANQPAWLFDPATMAWSSATSPRFPRARHTANRLPDGRIILIGGTTQSTFGHSLTSVEIYDPTTGVWSDGPPLLVARDGHIAANLPDGSLLVSGGIGLAENFLASPERLDSAISSWSGMGEMTEGRWYHSATLLPSGKILVAGGIPSMPGPVPGGGPLGANVTGGVYSSVEMFDPVSRTWSHSTPMLAARAFHTATLLPSGKVLVIGGLSNSPDPYARLALSSCEIYDPSIDLWTPAASMSKSRAGHAAVLLTDGRVLAIGGTGDVNTGTDSFEIYDPVSNTWTLKAYSGYLGFVTPTSVLALPNNKVLVSGVMDGSWIWTAIYDVYADAWTFFGPINSYLPVIMLHNNLVLMMMGTISTLYDPSSGTMSSGGNMSAFRDGAGYTLLTNGALIATGGKDQNTQQVLSSSERFDASFNQWTGYFSLDAPRTQHSVIQLNDGTLVVIGGGTSYVTEIGKP